MLRSQCLWTSHALSVVLLGWTLASPTVLATDALAAEPVAPLANPKAAIAAANAEGPAAGAMKPAAIAVDDGPDGPPWVVDIPWYRTARATDRIKMQSAFRGLLGQDFDDDKGGLEAAKERFDTAYRLCSTDPRLPYAYGIVLWVHQQPGSALQKFAQSQAISKTFFPPALQALSWCQIEQNQIPAGLRTLQEFAERLGRDTEIDPTYRQELYFWLGQMHGFVERRDESEATRELLAKVQAAALRENDPALTEHWNAGRRDVVASFNRLSALVDRSNAEIRAELEPQLAAIQAELKAVQDVLAADRQTVDAQKEDARSAEAAKNRANRELQRVLREGQIAAANLPAAIQSLQQVEIQARARMNTTTRIERRSVEDGYTNERYTDKDGDERTREVKKYKTINVNVPKSDEERASDRALWENVNTSLAAAKEKLAKVNAAAAIAVDLRKTALEANKTTRLNYRQLHHNIVANARNERHLALRASELETWLKNPRVFRANARTIPPHVPWYADEERLDVLASLTAAPKKDEVEP